MIGAPRRMVIRRGRPYPGPLPEGEGVIGAPKAYGDQTRSPSPRPSPGGRGGVLGDSSVIITAAEPVVILTRRASEEFRRLTFGTSEPPSLAHFDVALFVLCPKGARENRQGLPAPGS